MKVLGLVAARNAECRIGAALESLSGCCDDVFAIDDRSTDGTRDILGRSPIVSNLFSTSPTVGGDDWAFPESSLLTMFYAMAELDRPEWIVKLDDDQDIDAPDRLRMHLAQCGPDVLGVETRLVSTWADPSYPLMVPLMGSATSWSCHVWRFRHGLVPGGKALHNGHAPANLLEKGGRLERCTSVTIRHRGWDTLDKRIKAVRRYQRLDPHCELNFGVAYDKGLLFGYALDELDTLIATYHLRVQREAQSISP